MAPHPRLILLRSGLSAEEESYTLAEERRHQWQQRRDGRVVLLLRWFLSRWWRSEYELDGAAAQIRAKLALCEESGMYAMKRVALLDSYAESRDGDYGAVAAPFGDAPSRVDRRRHLEGYLDRTLQLPRGRPVMWLAIPVGVLSALGVLLGTLASPGLGFGAVVVIAGPLVALEAIGRLG